MRPYCGGPKAIVPDAVFSVDLHTPSILLPSARLDTHPRPHFKVSRSQNDEGIMFQGQLTSHLHLYASNFFIYISDVQLYILMQMNFWRWKHRWRRRKTEIQGTDEGKEHTGWLWKHHLTICPSGSDTAMFRIARCCLHFLDSTHYRRHTSATRFPMLVNHRLDI